MNTLELIKDSCLFGGTVPNERTEEVRTFLDRLEKQLTIPVVSQQRELLENFADWMDKNVNFDGIRQEEIDSYIAEKIL